MATFIFPTWPVACLLVMLTLGSQANDLVSATRDRYHRELEQALVRAAAETNNVDIAIEIGRLAGECAELATNKTERATMAQTGLDACQRAIALQPKSGAAYYYLGLNLGLMAQTRGLSALGLVSDMEQALLRAIELDSSVNYAGPHRTLGVLYLNAPGWPLSIGDKKKSQQHLTRAIALQPGFPENQLALLEARIRWKQSKELRESLPTIEPILKQARTELTGEAWSLPWEDWDARWTKARHQAQILLDR